MITHYKLTIPQTIGELRDRLGSMVLSSPDFTHERFPGRNIDTAFGELFAALENLRKDLGEERFERLVDMAARMRTRFEENKVRDGNAIADDMQKMLINRK